MRKRHEASSRWRNVVLHENVFDDRAAGRCHARPKMAQPNLTDHVLWDRTVAPACDALNIEVNISAGRQRRSPLDQMLARRASAIGTAVLSTNLSQIQLAVMPRHDERVSEELRRRGAGLAI